MTRLLFIAEEYEKPATLAAGRPSTENSDGPTMLRPGSGLWHIEQFCLKMSSPLAVPPPACAVLARATQVEHAVSVCRAFPGAAHALASVKADSAAPASVRSRRNRDGGAFIWLAPVFPGSGCKISRPDTNRLAKRQVQPELCDCGTVS